MNARSHSTVLIIGAGPSGLALARELSEHGIEFLILDKGRVADSWSRMPSQLKLVSPWKTNWLSADSASRFRRHAQLSRADFLEYLRDFATEHRLSVREHCAVSAVDKVDDGFVVQTSEGEFSARMVVNATGYFSNPVTPRFAGDADTEIPRLHYAQYTDVSRIASLAPPGGQILIVGHRLSAGQLALELWDSGWRVAISHRTPIRFGVGDWLWPLVYRTFPLMEAARLRWGGDGPLDVPMPGGRVRKLIQAGMIPTFPAIRQFERDVVVFVDGRKLTPALVIFATGFAPSLGYLEPLDLAWCPATGLPLTCQMESVSVPNLFFLGFEMLRNFQSRFLRGLRRDATILAERIAKRAAEMPQTAPPELSVP